MKTTIPFTHDEQFLRRFRTKDRVGHLTTDEVEQLRQAADKGDAYARYGYGRWLYYLNPYPGALLDAEKLFYAAQQEIPDSLAAYAQMLRYGETELYHPPVMDIEENWRLLDEAVARGSVLAATQQARHRIFGNFCEAEPERVKEEIEQRLEEQPDSDPMWYTLLAFVNERLNLQDEAIRQYEKAITLGETEAYGYLALIYKDRGNEALYEEYMEEGCEHDSTFCCFYQADTDDDLYDELDEEGQQQLHQAVADRLAKGLAWGDGTCAYFLWLHYHYGGLGFEQDEMKARAYLRRGVELADGVCISQMLEYMEDETERDELRLRAARYSPNDKDALQELRQASDPAFLMLHKEELEKYWQPKFLKENIERQPDAQAPKTPIDPMVIIIWPGGHLELDRADVYEMKSRREMAQEIIGAEGLDAVYYSPLLQKVAKAAELEMDLAMFVDRDAYAKNLADNAIGTMLYGQGMEIRGPIIITQSDPVHDCHSFKTLEDIVRTYVEINNHCGGLLIINDEDDGRYDAYA